MTSMEILQKWDVVIVIASLISMFLAVLTPIIKLNTTITKLNASIAALGEKMNDINSENKHQHDDLFGKCRDFGEAISNHETRITVIEQTVPRRSKHTD